MQFSSLNTASNRVFDFICLWLLPLGYLLLLSDMFFLPGRSVHHKIYYALFSAPALIAILLRPRELKELVREPLFIGILAFVLWTILSLLWSPPVPDALSDTKPPLHTLMLFIGCSLLVRYRPDSLQPLIFGAATIALIATLYNLFHFWQIRTPEMRMIGAGAFDNPLLSSHAFGFFCAYWMSLSMTCKRPQTLWLSLPALAIMFCAVIATGSRTPLVALTLAALWLSFICWNRRSLMVLGAMLVCGTAVFAFFSEMLFERGNSFRFELWRMTLEQIALHPWIGHGYNAELSLDPGIGYNLSEPHNFALGVLFYAGIIGFIPWIFMIAWGLFSSWRQRAQPLFVLASSWLVFGIGAGLTEGGGTMSRPKEHWYLLWVPLALILALTIARRTHQLLDRPVKSLSSTGFAELGHNARVIEEDGLGPKVLRLENGTFLKLFRRRHCYSSGAFNPLSERFAINSERLRSLGIATPVILGLHQLDDGGSSVQYQPLPGQTLRQVLQSMGAPAVREALVERFGKFLGQLHERGVYFRSLHLGNVLLMDDGEFGLIDLADMRIYPSPLRQSLRQRNLRHMQRYQEDRGWLFEEQLPALLKGYASTASDQSAASLHKEALLLRQIAKA
ncbi:O-antigen ligase family protein [Pseudomonas gingeri]|uniref:bifunctional O-antigen ligase/aminoglycoside phosphotransferase family protein n=1 Tax=Pseudomonas gingeri TaxID=117681 RepID=UPI0015A43084|nr:bifunctional O-antigen ligase/aminoglycoside phosphotransferase family protein [Pseudomonas gingeri]NVZ61459.1 O-antigen ligase family protein [Pseudomonas gingeri]NVZ77394.1 O-antigen ligase family protein [Pseudomonas gingeri]